jgi:SAM-dependent methyltransferase
MPETPAETSTAVAACDLCGARDQRIKYPSRLRGDVGADNFRITDNAYGVTGQIVTCARCGLIYASPRPSGARIEGFYATVQDPEYCQEVAGRSVSCQRIVRRLEEHLGAPGRLLDIGASTGILLRIARDRGWTVAGVEPSAWAVAHAARADDLTILQGGFPHPQLAGRVYDAVTMVDVIEHLDSPRRALEAAHELLAPGGLLCLVTPDVGSAVARLLGRRWWHYRVAHLFYFNHTTLWRLLQETGFEIVVRRRYGWTFSVEYLATRIGVAPVRALLRGLRATGLGRRLLGYPIRVNFGDSFELYARRS